MEKKKVAGRIIRQFPSYIQRKSLAVTNHRDQKMGLNPEHISIVSLDEQINQELLHVVRERLAPCHVQSVDAVPTEGSDGDPVFLVTIVLSSEKEVPDRSKMLGLVRHIRPILVKAEEGRFPLLSFVSASELDQLERESA